MTIRFPLLCFLLLVLTACASLDWQAPHLQSHPLVGRIYDVGAGQFIEQDELGARILAARFVLLGETHDNPDHHRLQTELLKGLLDAGKHPALVMEQFDVDQQNAIERARTLPGSDADSVATAAAFNRKGWGWDLYQPLVALALEHDLPLAAANLPRSQARKVVADGFDALGDGRVDHLGLEVLWDPARQQGLERDIEASHCGQLPDGMLDGLVKSQRARDAVMAEVLAAFRENGAVLIAGKGHVRKDRAVPLYLSRLAPDAHAVAVGFFEVSRGLDSPESYLGEQRGASQFDYIVFTPQAARSDPCIGFHMSPPKPAKPTPAGVRVDTRNLELSHGG